MCYLTTIFVLVCCILQGCLAAYSDCGVCTEYGIACVSETDFHICVAHGSSAMNVDESVRYSCSEGEICTGLREVCVSNNSSVSTLVPLCTDYCDVCEYGRSFACTSRTTFALCRGNEITNIVGTCPPSLICNIDGPEICIEVCGPYKISCDRDFPTLSPTSRPTPLPVPTPRPTMRTVMTPTVTPIVTPAVTPATPVTQRTRTVQHQTPWEVCAAKKMAGRFPYDNDSSCSKYVYCRFQGSVLVAVPNTCAIDTYFNLRAQLCETIKPNWCI